MLYKSLNKQSLFFQKRLIYIQVNINKNSLIIFYVLKYEICYFKTRNKIFQNLIKPTFYVFKVYSVGC